MRAFVLSLYIMCIAASSMLSHHDSIIRPSVSSSFKPKPVTTTTLTIPKLRGGGLITADINEHTAKLLCSALVTLVFEFSCGHLFEFLKILKQTSDESYVALLKGITKQKGVLGVYDGFFPWGVIQSIGKGGIFGLAHSVALTLFTSLAISNDLAQILAGGVGGGFQGYVLSPMLLLKTRVMTDPVFREVSERSERAFWKTSIFAMKCVKWLQTLYYTHTPLPLAQL